MIKAASVVILIFISLNVKAALWPKHIDGERIEDGKKTSVPLHGKKSDKITIVFFWASWCQYCKELAAELSRIEAKNQNLYNFVGISTDVEKKDAIRPAKNQYRFIKDMYWINTKNAELLDISVLPTVAIINHEGKIDTIYQGSQSDKVNYLKKRLSYFEKSSSPDMDRL